MHLSARSGTGANFIVAACYPGTYCGKLSRAIHGYMGTNKYIIPPRMTDYRGRPVYQINCPPIPESNQLSSKDGEARTVVRFAFLWGPMTVTSIGAPPGEVYLS